MCFIILLKLTLFLTLNLPLEKRKFHSNKIIVVERSYDNKQKGDKGSNKRSLNQKEINTNIVR